MRGEITVLQVANVDKRLTLGEVLIIRYTRGPAAQWHGRWDTSVMGTRNNGSLRNWSFLCATIGGDNETKEAAAHSWRATDYRVCTCRKRGTRLAAITARVRYPTCGRECRVFKAESSLTAKASFYRPEGLKCKRIMQRDTSLWLQRRLSWRMELFKRQDCSVFLCKKIAVIMRLALLDSLLVITDITLDRDITL